MARKNDPYLPLYVMDWLTNLRLKQCSLQAHGLMISIMCVMHKSDDYGKILLRQKSKICLSKKSSKVSDFASTLARFFAWSEEEITPALDELLAEGVLSIEGDSLVCRRMVRDGILSEKRGKAGTKGGKATQDGIKEPRKQTKKDKNFATDFAKAKNEANTENEIESESDNESSSINTSNGMVLQGGAGGIERPSPEFHAALYLRFTAAYGGTGRNPKRTSIEYALLAAMDDCMASIKADAEIRGVNFSAHELQMAAASFLCAQAHACLQQDTAHRNKRMNPETWLSEKCYQSHVEANAPPPTEKESPANKAKRELLEYHAKRREKEAQNGQ